MRRLLGITAALLLVSALPVSAATKGMWSLGANFGTGMYSNSDLNEGRDEAGVDEVSSGWEYGGSLRYQVSPKMGLDLEFNRMNPKVTHNFTGTDIDESTPGMAIPVNLVYNISENDKFAFNIFGGPGMVTGAKYRLSDGTDDEEVSGGTSFYGQAGLETQWMVSPTFALGARALGRTAKSEIENSDPTVNIDYSGFSFGLGARMFFGGTH
jgi:hypothetical protein